MLSIWYQLDTVESFTEMYADDVMASQLGQAIACVGSQQGSLNVGEDRRLFYKIIYMILT